MGQVIVWNTNGDRDYTNEETNFYIGRTKDCSSPLANPFTHNGKRSNIAKLSFPTREEALEAYKLYFDKMYGTNQAFTEEFDKIYQAYKSGKDVYLQCFCAPKPCHGDFLAKKLQERLIKERLKEKKAVKKK